jgi:Flp pilus assembly pilin Flp
MLVPIRTDRQFRSRTHKSGRIHATPARHHKRRGATAMEFAVVLSFVFVVIFAAVHHLGTKLGSNDQNTAQKVAPVQPGR